MYGICRLSSNDAAYLNKNIKEYCVVHLSNMCLNGQIIWILQYKTIGVYRWTQIRGEDFS